MVYHETPPPKAIRHLVKAAWTLSAGSPASDWICHTATPDGCIEIVRRFTGRSMWRTDQPSAFVAGLITRPVEFRMSGHARFVALRVWPWTWNAMARIPSNALLDGWVDMESAAPDVTLPNDPGSAFDLIPPAIVDQATSALAQSILASHGVKELVERSGRPYRWFQRNIGVSPSTYLRLLRFQETFVDLQHSSDPLAHHAATHGFADQAHMAREFRSMSGTNAAIARKRAQGPFL